ncbi:tail fiber protein, partial [Salmonella enterica subsp. enterica serovar Enteritidis]|nr:tail fiber protein [Salmonella enterica subsp. enterica serovar Enteritidis]
PGQVIMFAGKNAPAGTLLCNGAAVSRTTYAELFAAIGTLYGAGDGSTTFNLPAMLEGTVVTHTQKPETVGTSTAGEVLKHTHGASSAAAGSHSHGASTGAAGDHAHTGWTDQQGHHAHTGSTNAAGDHQHGGVVPSSPAFVGYGVYREIDNDAMYSEGYTGSAGNHTHSFSTDGAGGHTHSVGMNGSGNHTHTVSVGQAGEHSHAVTVSSSGGDRNLPAGLRMIYCIVH